MTITAAIVICTFFICVTVLLYREAGEGGKINRLKGGLTYIKEVTKDSQAYSAGARAHDIASAYLEREFGDSRE